MVTSTLFKLLVSLALIIGLNTRFKNLTLSLMAGTVVFGLWIGIRPLELAVLAADRIANVSNLTLLALVSLVIILSGQMQRAGLIDELVRGIRGAFSPRTALAVLPAVIGLLPMPGGALFSAPLLDHFDDVPGVTPELKTRVNYWFRHVWEYAWPLYPGILLSADIAGLELWVLFIAGLPMSVAAILAGIFVFLSRIPKTRHVVERGSLSFQPFLPIAVIIVVSILLHLLVPSISEANQYLPMAIGLTASILLLQLMRPLPVNAWKTLVLSKKLLNMIMLVMMIRIYGACIEAEVGGMNAAARVTLELQSLGIPALPLIMLLPFIAGMTMGISVGFVGAAMPVAVALAGGDGMIGTTALIPTVILAYACGFMGTMLSPLHVCLIVTCDYYRSRLVQSLQSVLFPAILIAGTALLYSQVLEMIIL